MKDLSKAMKDIDLHRLDQTQPLKWKLDDFFRKQQQHGWMAIGSYFLTGIRLNSYMRWMGQIKAVGVVVFF